MPVTFVLRGTFVYETLEAFSFFSFVVLRVRAVCTWFTACTRTSAHAVRRAAGAIRVEGGIKKLDHLSSYVCKAC